ncbi:cupin domain-containing protein [Cupriavidus sp. BIC8F]|uniref:cupin domain-containing protein n=1 Tax=Cupriavidus sp. BIC8F TaxID=3079014 RepID=UPI002916BDF9|nr:cupin domain-containing protein [Cupriavidus sp. BIC8F]
MPITIIPNAAQCNELTDDGPVGRPLSQPPCRTSSLRVTLEGAGENRTGLWECTAGNYERQVPEAEVMHILAGACVFTPTGGEPMRIKAGDTLFFPANTAGTWEIQEPMRKVFVILK